MDRCITSIYRCSKKEGMYLYVDKAKGTEDLPAALLKQCGKLELAMTIMIEQGKKLARADSTKVLQAIEENGFYLQMPPVFENYMNELPNADQSMTKR